MKNLSCIFFFFLVVPDCDKRPDAVSFCSDCNFKTSGLEVIKNREDWIVYLEDFDKYAIQAAY